MKKKIIFIIAVVLIVMSMMVSVYAESGVLEGELANIEQVDSEEADFMLGIYNYEEKIDDEYYYSSEKLQDVIDNLPENIDYSARYFIDILKDIQIDETLKIPAEIRISIESINGSDLIYTGEDYAIENNGDLYINFGNGIDYENYEDNPYENATFENGIKSESGSGILNNDSLTINVGTIEAKEIGIKCNNKDAIAYIGDSVIETDVITIKAQKALEHINEEPSYDSYFRCKPGTIYSKEEIDEDVIYIYDRYKIKITNENGEIKYEIEVNPIDISLLEGQKKYVNENDVVEFYIYLPNTMVGDNSYTFFEEFLKDLIFKVNEENVTENVAWGYRGGGFYFTEEESLSAINMDSPDYYIFFITCTNLEGNGKLTIEVPYYLETIMNTSINSEIMPIPNLPTPGPNTSFEIDTGIIVDNIEPGKEATIQKNADGSAKAKMESAEDAEKLWIRTGDNVRILEVPTAEDTKITVAIPKGFEIAELDETTGKVTGIIEESRWGEITEEDINNGLVIVEYNSETEETGNEFVWIPSVVDGEQDNIEDVVFGGEIYNLLGFIQGAEYSLAETSLYNRPSTPYEDFIEMFEAKPEIIEKYGENYLLTYNEMLEAIEEIYKDDADKKQQVLELFENEYVSFEEPTQTDEGQKEIIDSVGKYHGFYVGRYEIGANDETYNNAPPEDTPMPGPEIFDTINSNSGISIINNDSEESGKLEYYVQREKYPLVNMQGYYDYAKVAHNLHPGLTRIMGKYSYNAVRQWLGKNGIDLYDTEDKGNSGKNVSGKSTGITESDRLLNIYDLIGNVPEVIDEWIISGPSSTSLDEVILEGNEWDTRLYDVIYNLDDVVVWNGIRIGLNPMPNGDYEENVNEWYDSDNIGTRAVLFVQELPEWEEFTKEKVIEKYQDDIEIYVQDRAGNVSKLDIEVTEMQKETKAGNINKNETYSDLNDALEITDVVVKNQAQHGTARWDSANKKVVYEPEEDYVGEDTFTVQITDEAGNVKEIEYTITVTEKSRPSGGSSGGSSKKKETNTLTANADEYRGYVEDVFHITKENGLLKNDESEKDVKFEVKDVNGPKHGKLYKDESLTEEGINEDGSFYYVPDEGYIGEDTFTYTITDGNNESKEGTVTLVVKEYKLQEEEGNHTWYIRGYDDGEVKADNAITREEISMIFYRLTQSKDKESYEAKAGAFEDVEIGRWSNTAISYLKEKGIIQGYPDGTFRPTATVTRAEFVAIVEKYLEENDGVEVNYADVSNSHWAKEMINEVSRKGWMQGYPDDTFKPEKAITRAETMTAINRMLNRKLKNASSSLNIFPDLSMNHWAYNDIIEATTTHEYDRQADGYEVWENYERPTEDTKD